jgi:hypothetical protein
MGSSNKYVVAFVVYVICLVVLAALTSVDFSDPNWCPARTKDDAERLLELNPGDYRIFGCYYWRLFIAKQSASYWGAVNYWGNLLTLLYGLFFYVMTHEGRTNYPNFLYFALLVLVIPGDVMLPIIARTIAAQIMLAIVIIGVFITCDGIIYSALGSNERAGLFAKMSIWISSVPALIIFVVIYAIYFFAEGASPSLTQFMHGDVWAAGAALTNGLVANLIFSLLAVKWYPVNVWVAKN